MPQTPGPRHRDLPPTLPARDYTLGGPAGRFAGKVPPSHDPARRAAHRRRIDSTSPASRSARAGCLCDWLYIPENARREPRRDRHHAAEPREILRPLLASRRRDDGRREYSQYADTCGDPQDVSASASATRARRRLPRRRRSPSRQGPFLQATPLLAGDYTLTPTSPDSLTMPPYSAEMATANVYPKTITNGSTTLRRLSTVASDRLQLVRDAAAPQPRHQGSTGSVTPCASSSAEAHKARSRAGSAVQAGRNGAVFNARLANGSIT